MPIAQVHVAADRTATLTVDNTTTQHPDLGDAMTRLTYLARSWHSDITVDISDDGTRRTLAVDASGRISAAPAQSQAESRQPSEPPRPAEPPQSRRPQMPPQEPTPAAFQHQQPPAPEAPAATPAYDPDATQPLDTRPQQQGGAEYPVGTPYSGPAEPTGPARARRQRINEPQQSRRRTRPRRRKSGLRGLTVPSIALVLLLVIALGAYFLPSIIGSPQSRSPESIPADSGVTPQETLTTESPDAPVPGFGEEPAWEAEVPQTASVTATGRGVLVVDGNRLTVLDPNSGQQRYESQISSELSFAVDTVIDGVPALLWRSGTKAQALFDGESTPVDYTLPENARVSSAGSSVLIKEGNSLSTFTRDGLTSIPTPAPGSTPMALDEDTLISAEFAGPVTLTDINSGTGDDLTLESPADNLEVIRWVTAGHGKIVTLWGEPGASTNSGHRIQLVVHSIDDGRIASTVSTTTDTVGEADWVRGQGYQRAVIGPYLFDMENGLLVRDGSTNDLRLSEPRGDITPAVVDGTSCLLRGNTAWETDATLLAVSGEDGYAIVRQGSDKVVGFPSA